MPEEEKTHRVGQMHYYGDGWVGLEGDFTAPELRRIADFLTTTVRTYRQAGNFPSPSDPLVMLTKDGITTLDPTDGTAKITEDGVIAYEDDKEG